MDGEWKIGGYCGPETLCINFEWDGRKFHRHDLGGVEPRHARIGRMIESIEDESGVRVFSAESIIKAEEIIASRGGTSPSLTEEYGRWLEGRGKWWRRFMPAEMKP